MHMFIYENYKLKVMQTMLCLFQKETHNMKILYIHNLSCKIWSTTTMNHLNKVK